MTWIETSKYNNIKSFYSLCKCGTSKPYVHKNYKSFIQNFV